MLVGQLTKDSQDSTERIVGSPPYVENPHIGHLFDKFSNFLRSQCPICEAELRATLCQCERCHKVIQPPRVGIVHTFTPPTGLAAANLVALSIAFSAKSICLSPIGSAENTTNSRILDPSYLCVLPSGECSSRITSVQSLPLPWLPERDDRLPKTNVSLRTS